MRARERGYELPAQPEGESCAVRWLCYSALLCESNPPARAAAGIWHSVFIDGEGRLSSCGSAATEDEEEEEDDEEEEEAVDEVAVSRARLDALAEEIEGVDAALGARVVEELLTQVLCRIDAVDVHGDADLRAYRKRLIRRAEARSSGG